jgi:uncharacterized protein YciI
MHKRIVVGAVGITLAIIAVTVVTGAQSQAPPAQAQQAPQSALAAQPRAPLFVVIYERASAWDDSKPAFEQPGINEHRQYLRANAEKLVGAAPFLQGLSAGSADRTVGMVIVMAASQEEAQALAAADPAVTVNLMKITVRRWLVEGVKAY